MRLATKIVLFITIWIAIYTGGFLYYRSLSSEPMGAAGSSGINPPQASTDAGEADGSWAALDMLDMAMLPLDEQKRLICDPLEEVAPPHASVGVVVVYSGLPGEKERLLELVKSLQGPQIVNGIRRIVIVDDHTYTHASMWHEWADVSSTVKVSVISNSMRRGTSAAKAAGASLLLPEVDVLVFLDPSCVIQEGWLDPLLYALDKHPHAVVYPGIDVLRDGKTIEKTGNIVAAFDWGLGFKWESVDDGKIRLGFDHTEVLTDMPSLLLSASLSARRDLIYQVGYFSECPSPSLPPQAFAIRAHYYSEMGGMPLTRTFSGGGIEHLELSLRVWLCGGSVIRVPCSRLAYPFPAREQSLDGGAVTQHDMDVAALSIAELWIGSDYSEYVFRARFTGRVPHKVEIDHSARRPPHVVAASAIGERSCASFDWFLQAVYPGLVNDGPLVASAFASHVESNYSQRALSKILEQYTANEPTPPHDEREVEQMAELAENERDAAKRARAKLLTDMQANAPAGSAGSKADRLARHEDEVKHNLLCEDYLLGDCDQKAKQGDCIAHMPLTIFQCPAACGLCDADGQFCSDLYLGKCPVWKKEGKCEKDPEFSEQNCRFSCGICTRANDKNPLSKPVVVIKKPKAPPATVSAEKDLDETSAYRRFLSGAYPDSDANTCALLGTPNGNLMDAMYVQDVDALVTSGQTVPVRIFCGIYTMEQNHLTSVKATIDTWGKRCDGFVAFSTATDPAFSAFNIKHEGEESYNNMWQKSRAIWKYIGGHFAEDYDFFLLGGDDMWFVIENLRAYLGSADVQAEVASGHGMYIGRRFFPPGQPVFNSGGAGAVLDKVALKVLVDHVDNPPCRPHQVGFWEDVNVAFCLAETGRILPFDTRDQYGRERFHPFTPGQHLGYRIPPKNPDWYAKYNPELKVGVECCSEESISFHYAKQDIMVKLHGYMYHCDKKPPLADRSSRKYRVT